MKERFKEREPRPGGSGEGGSGTLGGQERTPEGPSGGPPTGQPQGTNPRTPIPPR